MTELAFAGYRSYAAGGDDPLRRKWDGVRGSLLIDGAIAWQFAQNAPEKLNLGINRLIKYQAEPPGVDVWQKPADTLLLGHGDCEDFAILKYALLAMSNVPVRLVVGEIKKLGNGDLDGNRPHAWCAAYLANEWHVLDQMFDRLIPVSEYINWLPLAACHDADVVRFGREFTINEILAEKNA